MKKLIHSLKFVSFEFALSHYKSVVKFFVELYCHHVLIGASSCYLVIASTI